MATILIGGDVCPIGVNTPFFRSGDVDTLFQDLLGDFGRADLVITNLECPLVEAATPIDKTGPVFGAHPECIRGIAEAGIDVLCLANNHILDHGVLGLERTLLACHDAEIATVGAGISLVDAGRILVRRVGAIRVGILAMAEHEFSVATRDTAGANPLDLISYVRTVAASRHTFDYLIVLLHGGSEFLALPSPRLRDTCRFLVEMGANSVVVQHPHCLGGYEEYCGGHIVYGQGALVMDEAIYRGRQSFHQGVLVELTLSDGGGSTSMALHPFIQSDSGPGARRMDPQRADQLLSALATRARALLDDEYLHREWRRFCEEHAHEYVSAVLAHGRLQRLANRRGWLTSLRLAGRRLLTTRNAVCCETHREVLETIFTEGLV